jgi:hypothetical protein
MCTNDIDADQPIAQINRRSRRTGGWSCFAHVPCLHDRMHATIRSVIHPTDIVLDPDRPSIGRVIRESHVCAFCAAVLGKDDQTARLSFRVSDSEYRGFSAHALCLAQVLHPRMEGLLDIADTPPDSEPLLPPA